MEIYVRGNHPNELIQNANQELNKYKTEYETIRTERELERMMGVRLIDYSTGWGMHTFFGGQSLFVPQIVLQFKNISGYTLTDRIEIKVEFIDTVKNEMFGSNESYLIGYSESLQKDFSKSIFIYSSRGYTSEWSSWELSSLPTIDARIYINNRLHKTQNIRKQYRR